MPPPGALITATRPPPGTIIGAARSSTVQLRLKLKGYRRWIHDLDRDDRGNEYCVQKGHHEPQYFVKLPPNAVYAEDHHKDHE
mmetsp:Transcript_12218/g.34662  ORF Transcript_12218/g.34662 Transcript_12218/m.34662 type:complete len:83 (+) Transcript_12218:119-367(+)